MPQGTFATPGNMPSRGLGNHSGGSFDQSQQQDIIDGDSLQGPVTQLFGVAATPDAINPHVSGNYIISSGAIDPITLGLPLPGGPSTLQANGAIGGDDGVSINIWSDSAFVHTVTLPSAHFANGTALATVITFKAFRGSGVTLRAWNGNWQVLASNVTSIA
jgi:hypothetical protein